MDDMQSIFLLLASNAFRFYILWRSICKIGIGSEYVMLKKRMLLFGVCYMIDSVCIVFVPSASLEIFSILSVLMILILFHRAATYKKYFLVLAVLMMLWASSGLSWLLGDRQSLLTSAEVLVNFIFFILELLGEAFYCIKTEQAKRPEWYMLCLVPVSSMFLLYSMEKAINFPINVSAVFGAVILWLNVFVFYYYDSMVFRYENLLQGQQMTLQMRFYEEYLRQSDHAEKQAAAFRHDLKNHLFALDIMAKEQRIDELRKYLGEMEKDLERTKIKHFTGCRPVEMILEYFVNRMQNVGIVPEISVSVPENIHWNMYDMNIFLSNLLENAIEAAELTTDKILCMKLEYIQGMLKLELKNSYNGPLKISGENYLTTKQGDGSLHGYGLKNVRQIVKKYSGEILFEQKGQCFIVKAILYM